VDFTIHIEIILKSWIFPWQVMDCDAQLLSISETLDLVQQQKQRQAQSLARLEEDGGLPSGKLT